MARTCKLDDKIVPLHRLLWISDLPHFCGSDECIREGRYEARLEMDETLWATREERDATIAALESWGAMDPPDDT